MIEILSKHHKRENFDCGNSQLDNYLKKQANQDVKRKLSACFVLSDKKSEEIRGYYTLSTSSIPLTDFPEILRKRLPESYTSIPTILLGRLAIDRYAQGKGFGKILLMDALKRSFEISQEIGSFAIVVDPIDVDAENFYKKFDFIQLPDSGKMILAMKTLHSLFV